jgi:hypothetical protein
MQEKKRSYKVRPDRGEQSTKLKPGRKTTEIESKSRMNELIEFILYEKPSYMEFREKVSKKYNISARVAENLYKEAKELILARFQEKKDEIFAEQLNRTFDLLKRCKDSGNRRVEAEVLRDLNKLYGLDQKKIDITSNGDPIKINIVLSDNEEI